MLLVTPKTEFIPNLTPPQKTGNKSVADKNYEDYLKVLQIYRPDFLLIDEEDNYVISTPKIEIIEIEDVVLPAPLKPIPVIPQETVSGISDINKIISPNQFDNVDGDSNIVEQQTSDDEVKYIPVPTEVPFPRPIPPRKTQKQKLKQIREQKERYRKTAEKKAINFLNKKTAADLLKEHREKQKPNKKANKKNKPLLGIEDRLKRKRKAIEKLKDKDSPKQAREFVNSKKNVIKDIKTLTNKKRKLRSVVKSDDNFSDAETIQYAEPVRDTSKKDEI